MADNPKLHLDSSLGAGELLAEEDMGSQKISLLEHLNRFQCTKEKSDNFVIDMESFTNGPNKDVNANARITRSLSRKGSQRLGEKKINSNASTNDRDSIVATSPPRGPGTPEKTAMVTAGTTDHSSNPQVHHQITITTGNINPTTEGKCALRRNSFMKRSSPSWGLDPKRVLFFFATLSSMGTMLLIYFTLSIGKLNLGDDA
ncbi:hypothetical protein Tsubulata_033583 [Turnera subulata]|uniref:Uncharacterized protein n=1 Tax=Turnera subulata TaxID=218843 RepID=A0A9Q0FW95_9ROSI|nr:hypothetical protein Tsubulata_033583 [Turnera subulata]